MNDEKRTMVVWIDGDGDIQEKTLLTDSQIRLLDWLQQRQLLCDWKTFNILSDEKQPEVI